MNTLDLRNAALKISTLTLALSASPALLAGTHAENLLQNGSFEHYTVTKEHRRWKLAQLEHWQGAAEVWTPRIGKAATDGEHKIELDVGQELNTLSQTITTQAGQKYRVSLDAYARRVDSSDFELLIDDTVIALIKPNRRWQAYDAYFIGKGGQQTFSLREVAAQSQNGLGTIIDNVSLKPSNELLTNGSFENFTTTRDGNKRRWKFVQFTGWQGDGEAWTHRLGKQATLGSYKIELDVGRKQVDTLSQTIETQARFIYQLSLDAYAREANTSDFEIWLDDQKIQHITPTQDWQRYQLRFTGKGGKQTLSIKEVEAQNNGLGAIIDHVSLVDTGERDNAAPMISGTPEIRITLGDTYTFTPAATDADPNDTLRFSIQNKPAWASFDPTTGTLSGTPTEASTDTDIQISVSDGVAVAQLAPFTIKARALVNIAQAFGEASQGGTYRNVGAQYAVDGDANTYNHTSCHAEENWWQVKLPSPTLVSKLSIQSRSGRTDRINGATVYLSTTPYKADLSNAQQVATLGSVQGAQETTLAQAISANYLIVKAKGANCLHMEEVAVYGRMPEQPQITAHQTNYLLAGNTEVGSPLASISSVDYQSDELTYSLVGESPFSIDAQGNVRVAEPLAAGSYNVVVQVSDGEYSHQTTLTVQVTSATAVDDALASGDASLVTAEELIPAALKEVARLEAGHTMLSTLYPNEAIEYNPGNRTQLIDVTTTEDKAWPILQGAKGKTLAAAGYVGKTRFAAFGSVPMEYFQQSNNLTYEAPFKRLLSWLLANDTVPTGDLNQTRRIALSFASSNAKQITAWINNNLSNWTVDNCNDADTLASCYRDADLIISGWQTNANTDQVVQTLKQATDNGTPVLYLHTWYEAYNDVAHGIAKLLGFRLPYGGNYWANDAAKWNDLAAMQAAINQDKGYLPLKRLLSHFEQADYGDINLADCNSSCSNISEYNSEFQDAAEVLQNRLSPLDQDNLLIFDQAAYRLEKLLILLGDKYRQETRFPMDKSSTDSQRFLSALFADYSVYSSRRHNQTQADMGNFSRSDFSHITPVTKTVTLQSKQNFRAAGLYALPGQTIQITRNDTSDVTTRLFINTQRAASTHLFEKNGYKRPKFLKSRLISIKAGQTVTLSSPYGGPLQVAFDKNDLPVSFTFKNVGEHPFWKSEEDNDRFEQQLAAGDYDWAELVTPGFEVHSTLDKMRQSMSDSKWGNAPALAAATMRYMHNFPHALAGFQGPGIDVIPELHDFAKENNWTIHTLDKVQHMNADQATCGYGCSGNPYDAYWAYSPIGHGDVHELGHGLQGGKRFAGWANHTMTNYYSYFTKSQYHKDTGGDPNCQSLPFERMFNVLTAGATQAEPKTYIKANLWDKMGWSEGAGMFIQMMMAAQEDGALEDGWLLRGRLHMLEREYDRAKRSESLWNEKRDSLGFGQYSWSDIQAIPTNDWYLIAISYVTQRNFSDYFDMWAMPYGIKAHAQVNALNFSMMPKQYFKSEGNAYCYGLDKPAIVMDGKQSWE